MHDIIMNFIYSKKNDIYHEYISYIFESNGNISETIPFISFHQSWGYHFEIKNLWSWSVKIFKISITYVMIGSITIWRNSRTFLSYYVLRFTSWLRFLTHDVVKLEKFSIAMTDYISFLNKKCQRWTFNSNDLILARIRFSY